ncbi:MAG: arginase family protein [bacterium]|nr:arginase family protein [bacterium]
MKLTLVESPYDSGFRSQRMGAGPRHLINAGLAEGLGNAGHDVELIRLDLGPGLHGEIGAAVELMRRISRSVREAVATKRFPIVLSGNCNAAVGAVCGIGSAGTGVLWYDAHGDLHTSDTTESGFFDGMGYAMLLGQAFRALAATIPGFAAVPGHLAGIVGARDLDAPESEHIAAWGMEAFSVERLRSEPGLQALENFGRRARRIYVHVDLDVLDPSVLRANGFATPQGLTLAELEATINAVGRGAPVAGIGLASYDPAFDEENAGPAVAAHVLAALLDPQDR